MVPIFTWGFVLSKTAAYERVMLRAAATFCCRTANCRGLAVLPPRVWREARRNGASDRVNADILIENCPATKRRKPIEDGKNGLVMNVVKKRNGREFRLMEIKKLLLTRKISLVVTALRSLVTAIHTP